jgi:hypothetical protein
MGSERAQSHVDSVRTDSERAQSHVVGVALLLGITTLALAGLTVTVGTTIDASAGSVAAGQVTDGFERSLRPQRVTGPHTGTLSLTGGRLSSEDRELRLLNSSGVVARVDTSALVYRAEDTRVAFLSGAVVRGAPGSAVLAREPSITTSAQSLLVSATVLGDGKDRSGISLGLGRRSRAGGGTASGEGRAPATTVLLHTDVTHDRRTFASDEWRVAVETATPEAWEQYFERRGATTTRRDFDGDGVPSVVASISGTKRAILVVHTLDLEVAIRAE